MIWFREKLVGNFYAVLLNVACELWSLMLYLWQQRWKHRIINVTFVFWRSAKKNPHEMEWWLTSKSNLDILVKAFGCIFTYFHLTFFLMDFVDREYITRTHIASIYVHFFVVYWLILLLWKRVFSLYGYRIEPIQSRNLMHAPHHIR